jgi:hypothetical protein
LGKLETSINLVVAAERGGKGVKPSQKIKVGELSPLKKWTRFQILKFIYKNGEI